MEGPLSKWTNVVQGWQYRWFVLDLTMGVLSYYTSKDKMVRGERRGCVKLKNAQVGINDEDDSTFTITVDSKMFHFQAQNSEERQKWLDALQEARDLHTENYALLQQTSRLLDPATSVSEFDRRIIEADAYLQILIDQHQQLDQQLSHIDYFSAEMCEQLKLRLQHLIELVKKTIVCLQFVKENSGTAMINLIDGPFTNSVSTSFRNESLHKSSLYPDSNGLRTFENTLSEAFFPGCLPPNTNFSLARLTNEDESTHSTTDFSVSKKHASCTDLATPPHSPEFSGASHSLLDIKSGLVNISKPTPRLNHSHLDGMMPLLNISESSHLPPTGSSTPIIPDISYSSSEEENEEFFDTWENVHYSNSPALSSLRFDSLASMTNSPKQVKNDSFGSDSLKTAASNLSDLQQTMIQVWRCLENIPMKYKSLLAHDDLYDVDDEKDLGSIQSQGSVISYLLSQLRIGMDLTRITLPTFILEKRSTLEMYADFLAHPDLWIGITEGLTPRDRMVECLRWYLSAFHAGRRSGVCKKPYNPILGEVFRCCWPMTDDSTTSFSLNNSSDAVQQSQPIPEVYNEDHFAQSGPLPFAVDDCVVFLSEQVSHHPPISAFYAEYMPKHIQLSGHIWTKSKFLGLSIGVEMVGTSTISLLDLDEEYQITFPSAYGRNILSVPWLELGGRCNLTCSTTGYSATVDFRTKPFYGGKKDQIRAEVFEPNEKKPFVVVDGEWNGQMWAKWADGTTGLFIDTTAIPIREKRLRPRSIQTECESRRLWQEVTHALKVGNIDAATDAKTRLENRQRRDAEIRQELKHKWQPNHFIEQGDSYVYRWPLSGRINQDVLTHVESDTFAEEKCADFTLTDSNVSSSANGLDESGSAVYSLSFRSESSSNSFITQSSPSLAYFDPTNRKSSVYLDAVHSGQALQSETDR